MLDDRALTVNTASRHINRVPVLKTGSPMVSRVSRWGVIAALQVAEAVVIVTNSCFWLALILSHGGRHPNPTWLVAFGFALAVLAHSGFRSAGAYDFVDIMHVWRSARMASRAWVLSVGPLLFIALLFVPTAIGRTAIFGWLAALGGIVCVRSAAAIGSRALVRAGRLSHNVLIIGTGPEAQRCASLLRADGSGANVVALLSLEATSLTDHDEGANAVQMSDLQRSINAHEVRDVIISASFHEQAQLSDLVKSLLWLPVRVLIWPPSLGVQTGLLAGDGYRIGNVSLLLAGVPPLDGWRWVIKDVRDRLLAFLLLIFNLPVFLGIMLMIRLTSPGPILFKQQREGYGGSMFTIFKFRTMRVGNPPSTDLILTEPDDPRVFPVGALLRKTSLDELPQLINVLRGDMWLVGPRPHSPLATAAGQRYSAAVSGYMARLRVKPGITGWAQVNGWRGPTTTLEQIQQRLSYDLHYIEHLSLWLDLKVLLKTVITGFIHKNAY
jgi:Undecaprenyl-phosphate glucose phosphotransferase